jgi:hypothetical protein
MSSRRPPLNMRGVCLGFSRHGPQQAEDVRQVEAMTITLRISLDGESRTGRASDELLSETPAGGSTADKVAR